MLTAGQEIIYRRGRHVVVGRLNEDNWNESGYGRSAGFIRHYQPFVEAGQQTLIPLKDGGPPIRTSQIKRVDRRGNTLLCETQNSTYEIEYVGIDLDKILGDGQFQGVNESEDHRLPSFPRNE